MYKVVRGFDIISSAEIVKHAKELAAAKTKELVASDKLGACGFGPLSKTQNVTKPRWGLRRKKDADGSKIVNVRLVGKCF